MTGSILVSTAYLPPVEYISLISGADQVFIEKEENYLKQTYRNRCYVLSAHGPQILSVPICMGTTHKTTIKDIRIDYSKRWQQVHLGAIIASYSSSPFFKFYFENIEGVISVNHNFLLDLNMDLLDAVLNMLKLKKSVSYSSFFEPIADNENDYRYKITPKKESYYRVKDYLHVFDIGAASHQQLSIIDLLFNIGPDSATYLQAKGTG